MLKLKTCYHTEIVILMCFCSWFKTDFSQICSASLSFNLKEDEAWSIFFKAVFISYISLSTILIKVLQNVGFWISFFSVLKIVGRWRLISLTQQDKNPAQTNLYPTSDFRIAGDAFFDESKWFNLNGEKVVLMFVLLQNVLHHWLILFTSSVWVGTGIW